MDAVWSQLLEFNQRYLIPSASVLIPLAILGLGWFVALVLSACARRLLRRRYGRALLSLVVGEEPTAVVETEKWAGRAVFYTTLLFVLAGFFQVVGMTPLTEPLVRALNEVFAYAPRIVSAALLLAVAWVVASLVRRLLRRVLTAAHVDERLEEHAGVTPGSRFALPETVSSAAYWLVFLVFLPAMLEALALDGLLQPVREMLGKVLSYLPNLFGAALILIIGLFAARAVQRIVTSLLAASRIDELGARIGLSGERASLSALCGTVLNAFIMILVAIAALESLRFAAISEPASRVLGTILSALPPILVAVALMLLAYAVGRFVARILQDVLDHVGLDGFLGRLGLGLETADSRQVARTIGVLATIGIFLFAAIEAASMLGFDALSQLFNRFLLFGTSLAFGVLIFTLGLYLANLLGGLAGNGVQQHRRAVSAAVRLSILTLTTFMALREMGIAQDIINLAFGLLLGALAIAAAIAFGLGCRDIAARRVQSWLDSMGDGNDTP